ncbi:ribosomal RNA-processing protein 8 [Tribolium madens]|uniref:ribosomal RNA-processing protein 8 n=1 Tax=Tribolium madens TaxID=41895 RepID=UPI001CF7270D|nr:ribosomal RNA-processing protein 8 [Tribolium madens]
MFKVAKFDNNNVAEDVCKELFKKPSPQTNKKNKNKIFKGKVTKHVKEKKDVLNEEKIKNEIKAILNNSFQSGSNVQLKKKKKRKEKDSNVPGKYVSLINKNLENQKVNISHTPEESQRKKKKKRKRKPISIDVNDKPQNLQKETTPLDYKLRKMQEVKKKMLTRANPEPTTTKKQKSREKSLRERMMEKLHAARFRYLNEQIYSSDSKEAHKIFKDDPDAFKAYHEGYRQQVAKWPLNPLDAIIRSVQKMPKTHVIADFGCGDAKLAQSVNQKVHSFDLVPVNEAVTACDMAHVPLDNNSIDVVVFCLSLMGTNLHDYLLEANRVLVPGGILKIAEVESRFDDVNQFIEGVKRFNFKNTWKDLSHNLFYFLDFRKEGNIKNKKKLPNLSLNPCLYKKR